MSFVYKTKGTCAAFIEVELDGDVVTDVKFTGGCNGNLQGVSRLAIGRTVAELEETLKGIDCRQRGTSCPDQLALAVRAAYEAQ